MKQPLIVIGGPTACGKTALSIALAKRIGGEIISADSMQVYRYMDIGTAKVTQEEMQGVKHYMLDEVLPNESFHAMMFQQKAKAYIQEIAAKGKIPILVGGTGFYINAVVYDNAFTETQGDDTYRNSCYEFAKTQGSEALYRRLEQIDPDYAATVHHHNVKRVTRALEYYHQTGELFSVHNAKQKEKPSPYQLAQIILTMDRALLYQRIEQRVDIMIEQGLVQEVKWLLEQGYDPSLVSMQGLGYKEIVPYLQGKCTLQEAVTQLKTATRRFAKRQLTWFRGQSEGLWVDLTHQSADMALEDMLEYIWQQGIGKKETKEF